MDTKVIVDRVGKLSLVGNIIPSSWYRHILSNGKKKRADLVAINILAEIIYWYRPGKNGIKKFQGDALRMQIPDFMEKFNLGEDQVKDALSKLRKLELITTQRRVIKNDKTGNFETLYFITPIINNIEKITTNDTSSGNFPSKEIAQEENSPPREPSIEKPQAEISEAQREISPEDLEKSPPSLEEEISPPLLEKKNYIKNTIKSDFSLSTFLMVYENNYQIKRDSNIPKITQEEKEQLSSLIENGLDGQTWREIIKSYLDKYSKYKTRSCTLSEIMKSIENYKAAVINNASRRAE